MFTGLVERVGVVKSLSTSPDHKQVWTLVIDPGDDFECDFGDSIAINGVCLSDVSESNSRELKFHVSPETLSKTSLSGLKIGSVVNMERSLCISDRIGGHLVSGHVDGIGTVGAIVHKDGFLSIQISLSRQLGRYVISKGSIAIDGISLTVNEVVDESDKTIINLMIVPVTQSGTSFKTLVTGQVVNIEVDMISKYVERLLGPR
jgi:riboflavin synthase